MIITDVKNLESFFEAKEFKGKRNLTKRENELMGNLSKEVLKRDHGLVENLNPSTDYCIVSIGMSHIYSSINKLQNEGYKLKIFLPRVIESQSWFIRNEKIRNENLRGFEKTLYSKKEGLIIADIHTMIYSLDGILRNPEELLEGGIKEISICLEHSRPGNEQPFLFKKGKHCFHIYDELRDYALKCRQNGIELQLIGLECRIDKKEIC